MKLGRRSSATILLVLAALAGAQTTSQKLQDLQRQLSQERQLSEATRQRLENLRRNIAALGQQQREALARLDQLGSNVARLEAQSRELQERVGAVQEGINNLSGQIEVRAARTERLKTSVRALMRSLYQERSAHYLQLLSQAKSLSDLLIRARYANALGEQNVALVRSLKEEMASLQILRDQQLSLKAQLTDLNTQLRGKLSDLRTQQAQQQALLRELESSKQGQQALALQAQAQQQVAARNIDQLVGGIIQERARLEAERQARLEAERKRREEEARRLREAQEKLRRERERLAQLAREQAARRAQAAQQAAEQARQVEREAQAVQERQQQLQQQESQAQTQSAPLPTSVGRLSLPLVGGRISVPFGTESQWTVLAGAPGAQVMAAADGQVLGEAPFANEGWAVIVQHTPSLITVYSGLQQPIVTTGARVTRGQALGFAGGSPILGPSSMKFQVVVVEGGANRYVRPDF